MQTDSQRRNDDDHPNGMMNEAFNINRNLMDLMDIYEEFQRKYLDASTIDKDGRKNKVPRFIHVDNQ